MKSQKFTNTVILIKGILMILISIIHTAAIYFGYEEALEHMSAYWAMSLELWFAATGIFFLFIGISDLLSYRGLKKGINFLWKYPFTSGIFSALVGTIGTYFFRNDPVFPVFPFIIMLTGYVSFIILLVNRKKYSEKII